MPMYAGGEVEIGSFPDTVSSTWALVVGSEYRISSILTSPAAMGARDFVFLMWRQLRCGQSGGFCG